MILRGYTVSYDLGRDQIRFTLRDAGSRLDVPASRNVYAGTGGVEGDDLRGKRKPKAFGHAANVSATLVIPASRAYQVNDGAVEAIDAVYVKGVAMVFSADYASISAMNAAIVTVGHYVTCRDEGWFRLGAVSDSETSQVTCDVRGDRLAGVFVDTSAAIVRRLLGTAAGLADPEDIVVTSFEQLDAIQPAPIGYVVPTGDEQTVRHAVGRIMAALGGWCGANRRGRFAVRRFEAPSGTPTGVYTQAVIADVSRIELPDDLRPPPWRVRVGWGRNNTVQTTDIAGSVTDARRVYLAEQLRYAGAEDNAIRLNFPPGKELVVDAYFRDEADAQAEADRRLALFGEPRELYVVKLSERLYIHEPGQVVHITFDRVGLDLGRLSTIGRVRESYTDGSSGDGVELTVFA